MAQILLIEDDLDIRENTMDILRLAGHEVLIAENGEVGTFLAINHKPDVIICDIKMPVKTGYEVLLSLKANLATKNIPFVFFTSSVEKKEIQSALELGANGYIGKPFEPDQLFAVIQDVLERVNQK